MSEFWQAIQQGRHGVWLGTELPALPERSGWTWVRIHCDRPSTLGPLEDARQQVMALLGHEAAGWDEAVEDLTASALRRRVLGEDAIEATEVAFVAACNRLWEATEHRAAVILTGLEGVDEATAHGLAEILAETEWLRLPLVLHFTDAPTTGPAASLLESLERPVERGSENRSNEQPGVGAVDLAALPDDVRMVLRVATLVGPTFEADTVARVLARTEGDVLQCLQQAVDLGVPLADRGDGVFVLSATTLRRLRSTILPSLATFWHRQLAELLGDAYPASMPPDAETIVSSSTPSRSQPGAFMDSIPTDDANSVASSGAEAQPQTAAGPAYSELFHETDQPLAGADDSVASDIWARARPFEEWKQKRRHRVRKKEALRRGDEGRAARHLLQAGQHADALDRYAQAVDQLAGRGDFRRALALAREGLEEAAASPGTPVVALRRARLLAAIGRLRWEGAGSGPDHTLERALQTLEEAREALPDQAPAQDRAAIASLIAGVCYDRGDPRSLERALHELTSAARMLADNDDSIGAARLLNDQAAVYLRAGDPVRASGLLTSSRDAFEGLARRDPSDEVAIEELAETEHLLAKLPLAARMRPGREADAYSLAIGHARAAEAAYRRLQRPRALTRVWETLGRLELRRDRLEQAAGYLQDAAILQRRAGDSLGLARTAAGLSDVYAAAGRPMDALALLGESISLNTDKGSPLGLAFNRETIDELHQRLGDKEPAGGQRSPGGQEVRAALRELELRLAEAQRLVGRTEVPGR